MKRLLIGAVLLAIPSYTLAYEVTPEEISEVCKADQSCINIISDELSDILISGNLRHMTPEKFNESISDYCDYLNIVQCHKYVNMMEKTFKSAYIEGEK